MRLVVWYSNCIREELARDLKFLTFCHLDQVSVGNLDVLVSFRATSDLIRSYHSQLLRPIVLVSGHKKLRFVIPDFGENFGNFDRFAFDDFPPEFREHLPSHWNRRFGSREEAPPPQPPPAASPPTTPQPQQSTAATQTEAHPEEAAPSLPQYGLRNTVDLGQKSPADPSVVDAEQRAHRSVSAPPSARAPPAAGMSEPAPPAPPGTVHVIPIFVEGRDEPVVNAAPQCKPHKDPKPPFDRDQYFAEDPGASFMHQPNFTRAFGTPNTKAFRQAPQPFQQKVFPQTAFARGASPQRSQSPRPPPAHEERFVKVPVQHEPAPPAPPARSAAPPPPPPAPAQREQTPPHVPPKPSANDPITHILSIQTDVLNLMTEVENFTGTKKDKRYLFLDEMLTRNLIKLDNIETEGKENIRLARKEAIGCIQKCIAVLEAKAEKNGNPSQPADVDIKDAEAPAVENGEVEMKAEQADQMEIQATSEEAKPTMEAQEPAAADLREEPSEDKAEEQNKEVEDKPSPKKKVVKKRDKSKDHPPAETTDSNKVENVEVVQVDNKGDTTEQVMEVDGAASQ